MTRTAPNLAWIVVEAKVFLRQRATWIAQVANPMITFGLVAIFVPSEKQEYIYWVIPGLITMTALMISCFQLMAPVVEMRHNGTLDRIHTMPISPVDYLIGFVATRSVLSLCSLTILYIGGAIYIGGPSTSSLALVCALVTMLIGTAFLATLALTVGSMLSTIGAAQAVAHFGGMIVMLFSGTIIPLDLLPGFFEILLKLLPVAAMADAFRDIMSADLVGWLFNTLLLASWLAVVVAILIKKRPLQHNALPV